MKRYRRNPTATRTRVNLTLDPGIYESAQEFCYSNGLSVSELVNRLLLQKLRKHHPDSLGDGLGSGLGDGMEHGPGDASTAG